MTRIRVVQLVTGIAVGEQSGGAEQIALHIARLLDRTEFECAVYAMNRYDSSAEQRWRGRLAEEGIPLHGLLRSTGSTLQDMRCALKGLSRLVNVYRPDVISSHSERGDTLNALLRVIHPFHPSAVRTMHTDQQWQTRPAVGWALSQVAFPCVFDAEIAVSKAVLSALAARPLARLSHRPVALCYDGIDGGLFEVSSPLRCAAEAPSELPGERPRIGIVGRLAPQKGHTFLLQAMPLILQRWPAAQLLVIGSGELEQELREQGAALGIARCVHFLGSRSDVQAILPHLDLLVSASLWEGLPAAVLEAMALGVPVVATDVSGSREVVLSGRTGRLVPAGQPVALAQAVLETLDAPNTARQMAEMARASAERFTIQNAALCYAQVYRGVAASRLSRTRRAP